MALQSPNDQEHELDREHGFGVLLPDQTVAGAVETMRFRFTVGSSGMEEGTSVRLIPYIKVARTWKQGQMTFPKEPNYVTATTSGSARVALSVVGFGVNARVVGGRLEPGERIEITFGDRSAGSPGWEMAPIATRIPFRIYLVAGPDAEPVEIPSSPVYLDVKPAPAEEAEVIAPSVVREGEEFDVQVRLVDAHGNTTRAKIQMVEIDPVNGLSRLGAKEVDPQKSIVRIAYRAEKPIRTLRLKVRTNEGLAGSSNPMTVGKAERIFWGDLHCHSNLGQALETPEFLYDWARVDAKLDFLAHVEHHAASPLGWIGPEWTRYRTKPRDMLEYIRDVWEHCRQLVSENYVPGEFVPFRAFEWSSNVYGHMNVIYAADDGPVYYPSAFVEVDETPDQVWAKLESEKALCIPHHSSHPVYRVRPQRPAIGGWDWNFHHPGLVRLVEIYSKHGASEEFGGPFPIADQGPEGCVSEALRRGYRLGFVGGSDSHSSRPGSRIEGDLTYARGGLTAVFAERLDRASIFEALSQRRCYATTGARIQLRVSLNGVPMGGEVALEEAGQAKELDVNVVGTDIIDRIDVIKNGTVFNRFVGTLRGKSDALAVFSTDRNPSRTGDYYYVRVVQADGHMAWSSPIYITA